MKLKIKCQVVDPELLPTILDKGDWFDLKTPYFTAFKAPIVNVDDNVIQYDSKLINLGIAMELPKGYEAILAARSSLFGKKGLLVTNSIGIIDSSYCGKDDIWKLPTIAMRKTSCNKGERLCQFRLQLSQKASIWTKLKWLFISKIEFIQVSELGINNRGGLGSTGL